MTKDRVDKPEEAICPICYSIARVIDMKGDMVYLKCPRCRKHSWAKYQEVEEKK